MTSEQSLEFVLACHWLVVALPDRRERLPALRQQLAEGFGLTSDETRGIFAERIRPVRASTAFDC